MRKVYFIEKFVHDHEKFEKVRRPCDDEASMTAFSMLCVNGP